MARVYLLAPRTLVRDALAAWLQRAGHRVVGADGHPAVAREELRTPPGAELLLADLQQGCAALLHLLSPGDQALPPCVVLLPSAAAGLAEARQLPPEAIAGWVDAMAASSTLLRRLDEALQGLHQPPPWPRESETADPLRLLDEQERQLLALSARGLRVEVVARMLALAPWTAAQRRREAMQRLGLRDAAALTRFALHHGLISAQD